VARTGKAVGARWGEIDLATKLWIVPANRTKAGKPHRVPLSAQAIAIIGEMRQMGDAFSADAQADGQTYVFPGGKLAQPLSNMAFLMLCGE